MLIVSENSENFNKKIKASDKQEALAFIYTEYNLIAISLYHNVQKIQYFSEMSYKNKNVSQM